VAELMVSRVGFSFSDFYEANFGALLVQINAYVGNISEAQDIVQEAFSKAWPRWEKISLYEEPVGWVRRVAWNIAVSRWRRTKVALSFQRNQRPVHVAGPDPDRVMLEAALAKLPSNQRRAVILHYITGMTSAEIAAECDVPEGTVKSWLHRARNALSEQLGDSQ